MRNAIIHSRLPYAARDSHSFQLCDISTFSVPNPMVRHRSITGHPFGILIPGIAHYGPSHAPEPPCTSLLVFTLAYIAVDKFHLCREKKLAKTWQLAEPADTAPCTLYAIQCDRWTLQVVARVCRIELAQDRTCDSVAQRGYIQFQHIIHSLIHATIDYC